MRDCLNPGSVNKVRVESRVVGGDGCTENSTASTQISGNRLGFLTAGDIKVSGGRSAMLVGNTAEFVAGENF